MAVSVRLVVWIKVNYFMNISMHCENFESSVKISEYFHIDLKCALFIHIIDKGICTLK